MRFGYRPMVFPLPFQTSRFPAGAYGVGRGRHGTCWGTHNRPVELVLDQPQTFLVSTASSSLCTTPHDSSPFSRAFPPAPPAIRQAVSITSTLPHIRSLATTSHDVYKDVALAAGRKGAVIPSPLPANPRISNPLVPVVENRVRSRRLTVQLNRRTFLVSAIVLTVLQKFRLKVRVPGSPLATTILSLISNVTRTTNSRSKSPSYLVRPYSRRPAR